ncbi:hypothetical protein [Syntrophorhabdus aromaticivorans]|uniref:hypothetical protein n=1 Tax=Syntrophorhabdus aromaticivorans TaxID=328301 RepID=UPI00042758D6|nr:hypothetical protein [Syntrophorhabdus aromaticivorans]
MAALSHNRSKEEYQRISVQLSASICGKKARKAGRAGRAGKAGKAGGARGARKAGRAGKAGKEAKGLLTLIKADEKSKDQSG